MLKNYAFIPLRWSKMSFAHRGDFRDLYMTMVHEGKFEDNDWHFLSRNDYGSLELSYNFRDWRNFHGKLFDEIEGNPWSWWVLLKRPALMAVKRRWLKIQRGNRRAGMERKASSPPAPKMRTVDEDVYDWLVKKGYIK